MQNHLRTIASINIQADLIVHTHKHGFVIVSILHTYDLLFCNGTSVSLNVCRCTLPYGISGRVSLCNFV